MCNSFTCNLCLDVFCRCTFFWKWRRQGFFFGLVRTGSFSKTVSWFSKDQESGIKMWRNLIISVRTSILWWHFFWNVEGKNFFVGEANLRTSSKFESFWLCCFWFAERRKQSFAEKWWKYSKIYVHLSVKIEKLMTCCLDFSEDSFFEYFCCDCFQFWKGI